MNRRSTQPRYVPRQGNRGVQQGWAGAKPVPLPGMAADKVRKIIKKIPPSKMKKAISESMGGRGVGAFGGLASIIVPQLLDEVARAVPGRRTDASSIMNVLGTVGAFMPGGQWLPIIASLGGPIIDIIIAAAEAAAKNNVVPGTMTVQADLKDYADYVAQPGNELVTYDEWKQYLEKKSAQDKAKCTPITRAVLGNLSLDDFLTKNEIERETAAATKKADPSATRQPTKEEQELLDTTKGTFGGGVYLKKDPATAGPNAPAPATEAPPGISIMEESRDRRTPNNATRQPTEEEQYLLDRAMFGGGF
jgi:hypothetical protein